MLPMIYMNIVDDDDLPVFEQLYNKHKQKAYLVAFSILNSESLAEECVSEVFLTVAKSFSVVKGLEPNQQLKYIIICSRNCAVDMTKSEKTNITVEKFDDEDYFTDIDSSEYDIVYWKECIGKLSHSDMEILYLRCILQLNYKTISKALNISCEAARARAFAARKNLKRIIESENNTDI